MLQSFVPLKSLVLTFAISIIFGVTTANAEKEGVSTGNGSFITGLRVALSDQHPHQLELMQLIEKAKLPASLREEVLADLASVSILYSDESITESDLQDHVNWDVVSARKIRVESGGTVSERTITEYQIRTEANKYGLYYHSVGQLRTNATDPQLAALTSTYENKVIYFNPGLAQLGKEEQIVAVLHEQGHRLANLLGNKTSDERFVEAWAQGFYNYLAGRMTSEDFYRLLVRNGISTFTPADAGKLCMSKCFASEQLVNSAAAQFESLVAVVIKPHNIRLYGPTGNDGFTLVLDPSAFANYPLISSEKEIRINMAISGQAGYDLISNMIDRARTNLAGEVMHFRVSFRRYISLNEKTGLSEQRVELSDVKLSTEEFSNQIALLRENTKSYFSRISVSRTETPFILLDPEIRLVTQEGLGQLLLWVKGITERPDFSRELKFMNVKEPLSLTIDPLSKDVEQGCKIGYAIRTPSQCFQSWGEPKDSQKANFDTKIGLNGLALETLTRKLTFGILKNDPGSSVRFLEGGGVSETQISELQDSDAIKALAQTLFKSDKYGIYLGFLAEGDFDVEIEFAQLRGDGSVSSQCCALTDEDWIESYFKGFTVKVNRRFRNSPEVFAEIVRAVLINRSHYRFDDDEMQFANKYRVTSRPGRPIKIQTVTMGAHSENRLSASAAGEMLRGLGLE